MMVVVNLRRNMYKTIRITAETHESIIEIGWKNETFDDVLKRMLEVYKRDWKHGQPRDRNFQTN